MPEDVTTFGWMIFAAGSLVALSIGLVTGLAAAWKMRGRRDAA
jgi:hypothetical protein